MNHITIEDIVHSYRRDYTQFMELDSFPDYSLQTKQVSLSVADRKGFESAASTFYNPNTDIHTIVVSTNLQIPKYLIFHEFTHILDTELYAKRDKIRYAQLSGFTEYHASQIELLQMLGAEKWNQKLKFSMHDTINTFAGEKTIQSYLDMKYQHAVDIFSRADFPHNIEMMKVALGVLFNYYGLRSICEMYADDFVVNENNHVFLNFISSQLFTATNAIMHGWMNKDLIELSMKAYWNIAAQIIDKYKLR